MDLSHFQFDYELTWAVLFMNADRTIYGRYGSRPSRKDSTRDITLEGLRRAMEGALELHAGFPANKKELAGKTGPAPAWRTPEAIPDLKGRPNIKPADGTRGGCVHCHQAHDGEVWSLRAGRQPIPDKLVWPYPLPDQLGFTLDPKERATVATVETGSVAGKAGLKTGDRILRLDGQPVISIADVQWVLHHAKDPDTLKAELDCGGQRVQATLTLPAGWRRKDDFTWRVITWSMRHRLSGVSPLELVSAEERKRLGLADGAMALRVKDLPPDWVKDKNPSARFQKGDVIVEVDGRKNLATEGDYLAYLLKKPAGSKADVTVLRGGQPQKVSLTLP